jgi:hypothetical protein
MTTPDPSKCCVDAPFDETVRGPACWPFQDGQCQWHAVTERARHSRGISRSDRAGRPPAPRVLPRPRANADALRAGLS